MQDTLLYKQCNYSILLLLYDFEFENVEIKPNLKLDGAAKNRQLVASIAYITLNA